MFNLMVYKITKKNPLFERFTKIYLGNLMLDKNNDLKKHRFLKKFITEK